MIMKPHRSFIRARMESHHPLICALADAASPIRPFAKGLPINIMENLFGQKDSFRPGTLLPRSCHILASRLCGSER